MNEFVEVALTKETALRKFAIVVNGNHDLSQQVQKYLFDHLDARWHGAGSKIVKFTDKEVLFVTYVDDDFAYRIGYGTKDYLSRVANDYPEFVIKQELSVVKRAPAVIIDGKLYDRDRLLAAAKECGVKPL